MARTTCPENDAISSFVGGIFPWFLETLSLASVTNLRNSRPRFVVLLIGP